MLQNQLFTPLSGSLTITRVCFLYTDVEKERLASNTVPTNIYGSMVCVPDLTDYLEYNTPPILPADDRKPLSATPTPAHTPTPAAPAPTNNNFLHEGKLPRILSCGIFNFFTP